jgi:hypothetical protein
MTKFDYMLRRLAEGAADRRREEFLQSQIRVRIAVISAIERAEHLRAIKEVD